MSEMIERVAKAIAESHPGRDWRSMAEHGKDWWRDEARTAIEAMREPTPAMINCESLPYSPGEMIDFWQTMIDEALGKVPA